MLLQEMPHNRINLTGYSQQVMRDVEAVGKPCPKNHSLRNRSDLFLNR